MDVSSATSMSSAGSATSAGSVQPYHFSERKLLFFLRWCIFAQLSFSSPAPKPPSTTGTASPSARRGLGCLFEIQTNVPYDSKWAGSVAMSRLSPSLQFRIIERIICGTGRKHFVDLGKRSQIDLGPQKSVSIQSRTNRLTFRDTLST